MAEKEITTNDLAKMIKAGFDNTPTKQDFDNLKGEFASLDKKFNVMEKDVKYIKENLVKAEELEKEVEYIRNTFSIPSLKK
jgi:hypothetical protein